MKHLMQKWILILFPKKYHSKFPDADEDWKVLEHILSHKIKNKVVFREALRHRSHPSCSRPVPELSNERLEFLGDALINFYVGDFLYKTFPDAPEGELTKMRSTLVSREHLAKKGKQLEIGRYLLLGDGEERSGGRQKDSILSNAMEALAGAIYLDEGYSAIKKFIDKIILSDYEAVLETEGGNFKGDLLELIQKRHLPMPKFVTKKETGPDHKKTYTVAVKIGDDTFGVGKGKSKKIAEQEASRSALGKFNNK